MRERHLEDLFLSGGRISRPCHTVRLGARRKEDQLLDRGKLDGVHEHHAEALAEILAQLNQFALHGHHADRDEWWARRSNDADLEVRFRVEPMVATTG